VGDLGVFEAMANAGKLSAEAEATQGHELEKNIDRAVFRAKERFGAYLANSRSKSDFDERWSEVKPQVIKVIAEVTMPTPGVIRRVGAALRPPAPPVPAKKVRPSSAKVEPKTAATGGMPWIPLSATSSVQKEAWNYDKSTNLYTSSDAMQKFACPGCGTEQPGLGFTHCAGCERTWNSWPVRQAGSSKTGSTYVLMAREIKMRGDQFKLAANGTVEIKPESASVKTAAMEPPPGMSQPAFGTMPGDNSGAMGAPVPPMQPPTPGGDVDGDGDLAGGVTEGSPIDQIQDALQDAIVALKDVQTLSINPALTATAAAKGKKVSALRQSMDRFWTLHKQMNYVAGMLAKEANEAIRTADPRISVEAEFVKGFEAASKNQPLPAKTGKVWLEGYVAFHKQADSYSDGANYGRIFEPGSNDESTGARNDGSFLSGDGLDDGEDTNRSDAGPYESGQPASDAFAADTDRRNAEGGRDRGQGQSGSIQPTGARRTLPKGRK
jgi:hypothetical protein